jgi:site-specific recombinase XerD
MTDFDAMATALELATDNRYARLKLPRKSRSVGFRIVPFDNRAGSRSWRVTGWVNGKRIRVNFESESKALEHRRQLEADHLTTKPEPEELRATTLSREQLTEAEAAWTRLMAADAGKGSLLASVEHWIKAKAAGELTPVVVYWEDAVKDFLAWIEITPSLRPASRKNLRLRIQKFKLRVGHRPLHEIDADLVEKWIGGRKVSARSQQNDKLALSRFFSWCMDRPRRWIKSNPAAQVRIDLPEHGEPRILKNSQVKALLRAAQVHVAGHDKIAGRLVPYLAASLWAGIRPEELARLNWEQVNLEDGTIRIRAGESKVGPGRVIEMSPNLVAWLKWCEARKLVCFKAVRKEFDAVREAAGLLKDWPEDGLRHTAISHHVRRHGSFALTALAMGNSESVIRKHYHARVTSTDMEEFFAMLPE